MRIFRLLPILLIAAGAASLPAQQVDVHASYLPGDQDTHYPLVGFGAGIRKFVDVSVAYLGIRGGIDYAREEHLGPGRGSLGLDFTLAPHRDFTLGVPYAGAGVSLNISGGMQSEWSGIRTGVDAIAGIDLNVFHTDIVAVKLEERYGAIQNIKASASTRAGFIFGF